MPPPPRDVTLPSVLPLVLFAGRGWVSPRRVCPLQPVRPFLLRAGCSPRGEQVCFDQGAQMNKNKIALGKVWPEGCACLRPVSLC